MSNTLTKFCLAMLCLKLGIAPALATDSSSEPSLEELLNIEVESASRYAQPLTETPSSVTAISAEDIRHFGFRDLAEALQMAPGVHISRDRAYTSLGVRGFGQPGDYNTRILLMQDGARLNDPIYDQAALGNEAPMHLDWIKRLEFVAGPSSASYGSNALFGIANAVLWSGADLNGTRINLNTGSGRFVEIGLLSGGVAENGLDWVIGLNTARQHGSDIYFREYDQPGISDGVARGLDGEQYTKGLLKLSLGAWRSSLTFASRHKDDPTAAYGTLFNTPGKILDEQSVHLDIGHNQALSTHWDQQIRLNLNHYSFIGDYPFAAGLNRDIARGNWLNAEYSLLYSGFKQHRILLGTQLTRATQLEQQNFDVSPYASYLNDRRAYTRNGLFIQDEWQWNAQWLLNGGLRFDKQNGQQNMLSPRLALIHRASDALTLKAMLGRAFRYANVYEQFYDDGSIQKASPNLKPERIESKEIAADYLLTPNLRLSLSHYNYHLHDLITLQTDPADGRKLYQNVDSVRASGWGSQVETMLSGGWRLRVGFDWQQARSQSQVLSNSPHKLAKVLLDGPIPGTNWTLGLNLQGVDARRSQTEDAPAYQTSNLVLRQKPQPQGGAWSLAIYNLTGQRYWYPTSKEYLQQNLLPSEGREWRLRWEYAL